MNTHRLLAAALAAGFGATFAPLALADLTIGVTILTAQLVAMIENRSEIHQATGMVSVQIGRASCRERVYGLV